MLLSQLSMLVQLYNQQQRQQQQQQQQMQLSPTPSERSTSGEAQVSQAANDEQTVAMIAAKQLLQLQLGRQSASPGEASVGAQVRPQQPLQPLNQQQESVQQQQQPFDLSVKSSTGSSSASNSSSLNNSTGTAANSPPPSQQLTSAQLQQLASQHFQMQLNESANQLAAAVFSQQVDNEHNLDDDDDEDDDQDDDDADNDSISYSNNNNNHIDADTALDLKSGSFCSEDDYAMHISTPVKSTSPSAMQQTPTFKIIRDKDNNFSCQYCNKKYQSMGALKMHVRTHTLPCQCKICGKSFSRPWLLQGHIRTHTGEKPFKCDQCHRAFADRSNLRAHLQTHAKIKKYSCKYCLKTFSRMSLQVKHEEHCNRSNTSGLTTTTTTITTQAPSFTATSIPADLHNGPTAPHCGPDSQQQFFNS